MDIEIIIAIIIWILIIAYSQYSSKKEKEKKANMAKSADARAAMIIRQQSAPAFEAISITPDYEAPAPVQPIQMPALYDEGQRITDAKPAPSPQRHAKHEAAMKRPSSRDSLRKAIIWGEILQPKFDNP